MPLAQRLNSCRHQISRWKRQNRNNAEERIGTLRAMLDKAITSSDVFQQRRTK